MINKVILLGNLGRDAELRGEGDRAMLSLSLATEDGYFDKKNEWVSVTEWHNVRLFGKSASRYAKLVKGDKVYVEGKIKTMTKKDSSEKYCQIVADKIKVIKTSGSAKPAGTQSAKPKPDDTGFDDDIPF